MHGWLVHKLQKSLGQKLFGHHEEHQVTYIVDRNQVTVNACRDLRIVPNEDIFLLLGDGTFELVAICFDRSFVRLNEVFVRLKVYTIRFLVPRPNPTRLYGGNVSGVDAIHCTKVLTN